MVDSRERNDDLVGAIARMGVEMERRTLPVGDYLISDRVCIERKTIGDFESSIVNGRLFEQIKRLKEAYSHPIVIIEGDREEFRMKSPVINGTVASLYIDFEIPIIYTLGAQDTAELVRHIAKHEQQGSVREPSVKGGFRSFTQSQFMERIVGNIPGVGIETARNLLEHFGSVRALAMATEEDYKNVKNVGPKRAKAIFEVLNLRYEHDPKVSEDAD